MFDINKAYQAQSSISQLKEQKRNLDAQFKVADDRMKEILIEQTLIEKSALAINQAKPLLSASSIQQAESLANSAIATIFNFPYTVEWNPENQRFYLNKGDYSTDLAEAEGGGICAVISAILDVFLLVKMGKRRFLAYDEAFTQISEQYFAGFVEFFRQMCKDLGIDCLLVSHDARLTQDMVDHVYLIEEGHSKRLK